MQQVLQRCVEERIVRPGVRETGVVDARSENARAARARRRRPGLAALRLIVEQPRVRPDLHALREQVHVEEVLAEEVRVRGPPEAERAAGEGRPRGSGPSARPAGTRGPPPAEDYKRFGM